MPSEGKSILRGISVPISDDDLKDLTGVTDQWIRGEWIAAMAKELIVRRTSGMFNFPEAEPFDKGEMLDDLLG